MPLVVALPAVIIALVALLIILAGHQLGVFLSNLLRHMPLVGHWAANTLMNFVDTAVTASQAVLDHAIKPMVHAILAPMVSVQQLLDGLLGTGAAAIHAVRYVLTVKIPHVIAYLSVTLAHYFATAVATAEHYTDALRIDVRRAIHSIDATIASVQGYLFGLIHRVALDLQHNIDSVLRWAEHGLARVETLARVLAADALAAAKSYALDLYRAGVRESEHLFAQAEADLVAATAAAEAFATSAARTAAATAVGVLATDVEHVVAQTWVGIEDEVAAVQGVLATDLPDIRAALDAIPREVTADIPAVLAGVGALSIPMLRYLRECGVPNCRNLGAFGRALAELEHLIGEGALLAFVIAMATDPEGAARTLTDDLGPVVDGLAHGLRDLVGV